MPIAAATASEATQASTPATVAFTSSRRVCRQISGRYMPMAIEASPTVSASTAAWSAAVTSNHAAPMAEPGPSAGASSR